MNEAGLSFEVGERIRKTRIKRGISQTRLGKMVGVHRNTIWRWEDGDVPMPLWYFLQVCYALGTPYTMMLPNADLRNTTLLTQLEHENLPPKKTVQAERDLRIRKDEVA